MPRPTIMEPVSPHQYHQLLAQHHQLLETAPHQWQQIYQQQFNQALPKRELTKGKDFDLVIFGASLASLPLIAPKLLAEDSNMALMVEKVATNATQAVQTFSSQTLAQAGWSISDIELPITSGLLRPFDTWAVMNQLIPYEQWPSDTKARVNSIHYHCCVLANRHGNQVEATEQVAYNAKQFIQGPFKGILPNFDSDCVLNTPQRHYFRANTYGSERYVVSHVGTSKYRLKTDQTRFNNLYLTGDWIQNGINIGCIEGAVTSGLLTSRAICGFPVEIEGEKDV